MTSHSVGSHSITAAVAVVASIAAWWLVAGARARLRGEVLALRGVFIVVCLGRIAVAVQA